MQAELRADNGREALGLMVLLFMPMVWLTTHALMSAFQKGYIIIKNTTVYRHRKREEFWFYIVIYVFGLAMSVAGTILFGFLSWEELSAAIGFSILSALGVLLAIRRPKEKHPKVDWVLSCVFVTLLPLPVIHNIQMEFKSGENFGRALFVVSLGLSAIILHVLILARRKPLLRYHKPAVPIRKR